MNGRDCLRGSSSQERTPTQRTDRDLAGGEKQLELHALGLGDARLLREGPPGEAEVVLHLPHAGLQGRQFGVALWKGGGGGIAGGGCNGVRLLVGVAPWMGWHANHMRTHTWWKKPR